jgi:hypothetical protein
MIVRALHRRRRQYFCHAVTKLLITARRRRPKHTKRVRRLSSAYMIVRGPSEEGTPSKLNFVIRSCFETLLLTNPSYLTYTSTDHSNKYCWVTLTSETPDKWDSVQVRLRTSETPDKWDPGQVRPRTSETPDKWDSGQVRRYHGGPL